MKYILALAALTLLASCTAPDPSLRLRAREWNRLASDDDAALVPHSGLVSFPSAAEWAEIGKRTPPAVSEDEKDE
jgi:hypothetical protein